MVSGYGFGQAPRRTARKKGSGYENGLPLVKKIFITLHWSASGQKDFHHASYKTL
jgi:hypothetical protein